MRFKRRRITAAVSLVVAPLVAVACSSSSSSPQAKSFLRTSLAQGAWPSVPSDPVYMSVMDFPQPNGEDAPSGGHAHPPGFVFGLTGIARVLPDDGGHIDIGPGQAIFAPPFVHHSHSNPGPGPDDWLFLGPRKETVRTQPLPSPEAVALFNSATLTGLATGANYMLRLDEVTIRPGGQSPAQRQGGPTVVYSLEGQVSLHRPNRPVEQLKWGQAVFLADGDVWQVRDDSSSDQAKLLVMTMWQEGQSSETAVSNAI